MRKLFWLSMAAALITCGRASAQESGPLEHPQIQAPPAQTQPAPPVAEISQKPPSENLIVPSGTRMPLILHNAITTRNAHPGDPVYLETVFPIVIKDRILIPAGTYVQGEIQEAKRPGKVKGRGEIRMRLNSMILPNGYSVDFNAVPTNAGTGGNESTDSEGKIQGDSNKGGDVGTVVKATGAGAGIGAIASQSGKGAGIGAGVGAAAGLAAVLLTRGPEMELPRGTSVDIVTDRPIYLDSSRITFTDPGRATALPGPGNREPARNNSPF
jgi:type IV secretion system protein VirB10